MNITRRPIERAPTSPGEFVAEDILREYGLTQGELAKALGVSRRTINQIVNNRRSITADMALRLGRYTGTTAQFWLNIQVAWDLWHAKETAEKALNKIKPLVA